MEHSTDVNSSSSRNDADILLDALAEWDECYRHGEDRPTTSFGISDPALLAALQERIDTQKDLYAVMKLAETVGTGSRYSDSNLPSFPGHETESTIGRGGMGVVYKARDVKLNRIVAIKTVAWAEHASAAQLDRFLAEAEAVARLKHANVIPIYTIGEHEGRPYYTLEYAAGGNLADRLAQGPMPTRAAAELIETLALAVDAAHLAGIVHRDLKPSNVLLTAEGVPKVSDFGVAKLLDSTAVRTLSGEALGTPSYMAPEQAEGKSKAVGPAADVYALGAILYESLTGRPPFLGESAIETLKLVASGEVVSPRRLRPDVPRDLDTICLKCLEKAPEKRYRTADELAQDLRRYRSGEPIRARRSGAIRRLAKWARRHPWQTALAATLFVGAVAFIALTYRYNARLVSENRRTEAKAAEARRNYLEARSAIQTMLGRLDDGRVAGSPRLMDLRRDLGQDALAFYDRVLGQVDSTDPVVIADTIRALVEAAHMQYVLGQLALAETTIRRALPLITTLRSRGGDERQCLGLEVDCLMKLGATLSVPARREEAATVYERLIPLADRLAIAENDSPSSADLRAACHNSYASILGRDHFELAKSHYKQAIELRDRPDVLAIAGMPNRQAQSVENLGVIHWKERDYPEAERRFRQAEGLLLALPKNAGRPDRETAMTLGQINVNWVGLLWERNRHGEAVARANSSIESLESYLRIEPNDQVMRDLCMKLHGNRGQALGALGKNREAAEDWVKVIELAPEPVPPWYRFTLAFKLLEIGELDRALAQANLAKQKSAGSGEDLYNLACFYSRAAMAVQTDQRKKGEERSRLVETYVGDALGALQKAAVAGFFRDPARRDQAANDSDLKILRDREEFRRVLRSEH
jgi:tetratricopeptide (TPR) repeat protein/tRNA A-37 threonylcarbamoyl transferase component Bud32